MTVYNNISLFEMMKENRQIKSFEKTMSILVVSNINLKSPGESIIKYVLEKELKTNINIECRKSYEISCQRCMSEHDEIILLYFESEVEDESSGQKEMAFVQEIFLKSFGISDGILYISDAVGHRAIEKRLDEVFNSHGLHLVEYYDFYLANRKNYNYGYYDMRKFVSCDCAYSVAGLFSISTVILRYLKIKHHLYKKCLILDCDNVLWGGTLEERGVDGISLDIAYPGNIYYKFQHFIKYLSKKGVILALCSKNDEEDVLNMINSHPFMLIRETNVATYRINWKNKVENILDISNELSMDLNDFVFIDDSPEEIGQVNMLLPSVHTILFDHFFKYHFVEQFQVFAYFDLNYNTEEDASRNEMYHIEKLRKQSLKKIVDEKEYIRFLQLKLTGESLNEFNRERMVQLQTRTHRANLSSRIYSHKQLEEMYQSGTKITCYKLQDRYGEYGYIALTVIEEKGRDLYIKDFYLSCRALGKNIEKEIIEHMILSCNQEITQVSIDYMETNKNLDFFHLLIKILRDMGINVHTNRIVKQIN